jgi:hypothetical protein
MTCDFCEEARRRMKLLAALVAHWTMLREARPEHADEIDGYYREQYRRVANDVDHHADQT